MYTLSEFIEEVRNEEPPVDLSGFQVEDLAEAALKMNDHTLIGEAPNEEGEVLFDEGDVDVFLDNVEFYLESAQ